MSHHEKKSGKQKQTMDDDKNKQPPRAHEERNLPGERSDKDSIGQPVQLDREERQ